MLVNIELRRESNLLFLTNTMIIDDDAPPNNDVICSGHCCALSFKLQKRLGSWKTNPLFEQNLPDTLRPSQKNIIKRIKRQDV